MKNVVIHKIVKFIFTEDQMKSKWKSLGEDLDFDSLTNQQRIALAKKMLHNASHSDLEHHTQHSPWRTERDFKGKMVEEDDSDPDMHVEVIDTAQPDYPADVFIDRMLRVQCENCGFTFFIEDLDYDLSTLTCPKDGNSVKTNNKTKKRVNKK